MVKQKILKFGILLLLIGVFSVGCNNEETLKTEKLQIVTSTSILSDITKNIAGDNADIVYLVPIGDNPEDYEPIPSDLKKISNADLIIMNGWGLEEGITRAINNITDTNIVYGTKGITPIPLAGSSEPDPHAWLNVSYVANFYVSSILNAIIKTDPNNEEKYRDNAKKYFDDLIELDNWIKEEIKKIPNKNRIIIISENALKYYGKAYGFKTEGIWELNSHEEGTPQQIARIIDIVKNKKIPAIFAETTVDKRYMNIISDDTKVPIAGEIYTDALGLYEFSNTYIKMMKHNTNTFVNGLSK